MSEGGSGDGEDGEDGTDAISDALQTIGIVDSVATASGYLRAAMATLDTLICVGIDEVDGESLLRRLAQARALALLAFSEINGAMADDEDGEDSDEDEDDEDDEDDAS